MKILAEEVGLVVYRWLCALLVVLVLAVGANAGGAPSLSVETPPYPALGYPEYIQITNQNPFLVTGRTDPHAQVFVDGIRAEVGPAGEFAVWVPLVQGENTLQIQARSTNGNETHLHRRVRLDQTPPSLNLGLEREIYTNQDQLTIGGTTDPGVSLFVAGAPVLLDPDGHFTTTLRLQEGEVWVPVMAVNRWGNVSLELLRVVRDTQPPPLVISSPVHTLTTRETQIEVVGQTEAGVSVFLQGQEGVLAGPDGSFVVRVDLREGRNWLDLVAQDKAGNETQLSLLVTRKTQPPRLSSLSPTQPAWYSVGDLLAVSFVSERDGEAYFTLGDSPVRYPMGEIRGRYQGLYRFQPNDRFHNAPLTVYMTDLVGNQTSQTISVVTVLDPAYPMVLELTPTTEAVVRTGPGTSYDRLVHIGRGPRLEILGREADYFKVRLSQNHAAWVWSGNVELLPQGVAPYTSVLESIGVRPGPVKHATVTLGLTNPAFYTVTPLPQEAALLVRIFGARSGVNDMRYYLGSESAVKVVYPIQAEEDVIEVRIDIPGKTVYGYRHRIQGNSIIIEVKEPFQASLEGLRVTIDPGHGAPDSGAVGLYGLREADVNLATARVLSRMLEAQGAEVILTRTQDRLILPQGGADDLNERPAIAARSASDLFVSIHNNAASNRQAEGTETYYFNPFSGHFAAITQRHQVGAQEGESRFYSMRSFAVIRQTYVPSILTEGDFLSNPRIESWMLEGDFIQRNAQGIFNAILEYVLTVGI